MGELLDERRRDTEKERERERERERRESETDVPGFCPTMNMNSQCIVYTLNKTNPALSMPLT